MEDKYTMERLRKCINCDNTSIDWVDEIMIPILIELNEKHWWTFGCCEGHPEKHKDWNGYLAFVRDYDFPNYPNSPYITRRESDWWIWTSHKEEVLAELLRWAKALPIREPKRIIKYYLATYNSKGRFRRSDYTDDAFALIAQMKENKKKGYSFKIEKVIEWI